MSPIARLRSISSQSVCSPIKNPSEILKYRASRRSVSAVMARLPSTISLIRRGGPRHRRLRQLHRLEKLLNQYFAGMRILQKVRGSRRLDLVRMVFPPGETNSPLIVNADRMLSLPFAAPRFQPIARRHAKVFQAASRCSADGAFAARWTGYLTGACSRAALPRSSRFRYREA